MKSSKAHTNNGKKKESGKLKQGKAVQKPAPARPAKDKEKDEHATKAKDAKAVKDHPGKDQKDLKATAAKKSRNGSAEKDSPASAKASDEQVKLTRLQLLKARHEAMKREIDQIREDLESDEDE